MNKGQFKKGYDPRRHILTTEDRQLGFWNAIESIVKRHPEKIDKNNRHIVVRFLKRKSK